MDITNVHFLTYHMLEAQAEIPYLCESGCALSVRQNVQISFHSWATYTKTAAHLQQTQTGIIYRYILQKVKRSKELTKITSLQATSPSEPILRQDLCTAATV